MNGAVGVSKNPLLTPGECSNSYHQLLPSSLNSWTPSFMGIRATAPKATPPRNKALLRVYLPLVSLNKPLFIPGRVALGGAPLGFPWIILAGRFPVSIAGHFSLERHNRKAFLSATCGGRCHVVIFSQNHGTLLSRLCCLLHLWGYLANSRVEFQLLSIVSWMFSVELPDEALWSSRNMREFPWGKNNHSPSSHNHGRGKWVPPIVVTFKFG